LEAKRFIEEGLGENSEEVKAFMNTLSSSQKEMFYTTGIDGKRTFTFPVHLFQAVAYASEQAYRKTSQRNNIKGYTDDLVVAKQILGTESEADIDAMIKQSKLDYENEQMSSALVNYDQSTFGPDETLNTEQLSVNAVELNTENATEVRFLENVTFKPNAENIGKARKFEEVQKDSLMDIDGKESSPSDIPETATEVIFNPLISDYPMTKNLEVIKTASRVILIDGKMYVDGNISVGDHAVTDGDAVDGKSYSEVTASAKEKIMSYAVHQLGMNPKDVDVDYIYDKMSPEILMKMNLNGSFASNLKSNSDAISYSIRLRETAKKGAKRVDEAKDRILANPENYISPQRIKEIKAMLPRMSEAELIAEIESSKLATLMGAEDNFGPLAAGELINREIANAEITGDYDRVADIYSDAAKMGTTAGRILRQLRELQSTTPKGMAASIQIAAQKRGNYLTPEQIIKVEQASEKLLNATNNYNDLPGRS
jgi:phosphoribosylformylglycinamidine (FGAM) synthase PurS component